MPYFKWFNRKASYKCIHAWGMPGYCTCEKTERDNDFSDRGQNLFFVGYGSTTKIALAFKPQTKSILRVVHFTFDKTYSSIPAHSLPATYKNLLKPIDISSLSTVKFDSVNNLFPSQEILKIKLPLLHSSSPLNI